MFWVRKILIFNHEYLSIEKLGFSMRKGTGPRPILEYPVFRTLTDPYRNSLTANDPLNSSRMGRLYVCCAHLPFTLIRTHESTLNRQESHCLLSHYGIVIMSSGSGMNRIHLRLTSTEIFILTTDHHQLT